MSHVKLVRNLYEIGTNFVRISRLLHRALPPRSYLVFFCMCLSCASGAVRRARPVAPEKNRGSHNRHFQS